MTSDPARPGKWRKKRSSDRSTSRVANPRCASEMTYAGVGDEDETFTEVILAARRALYKTHYVCDVLPSATHEFDLRVRYAETDQMGVVYHTNYLVWCEIGRTELIRAMTGVSYAKLEERGVLLAVAELTIRYHGAARYDNMVRVRTTLTDARSRSVTFEYLITNADSGERLASAKTVLVSLDDAGRPVTMPVQLRQKLATHA
jgi:acyl-CoA thioester hydrolase